MSSLSDCYKKPMPTSLNVGGAEVGIAKLGDIMEAALGYVSSSDEEVRRVLLAEIKAHNYVPSSSEEEYLEAVWKEYQRVSARRKEEIEETYQGIPREEIPWYPRVNPDKCEGCSSCVEFCSQRVFEFFDGKSQVVRPMNCIVGKASCRAFCPDKAISFPTRAELDTILRSLRAKYLEG